MATDDLASKAVLSPQSVEKLASRVEAARSEFLDPKAVRSNVLGLGLGIKWSKGKPTGEPAVVVLVSQKLDDSQLTRAERIPPNLETLQTDVLAIGTPMAGRDASDAVAQTLATRARPARGGYSVGHLKITAGTISTSVYDMLPGGKVSPPSHGAGNPPRYYILSNNHVLANSNDATPGDAILQPGPFDGGTDPADRIGALTRFIPITFEPPAPRAQHRNIVDAAIAEVSFHDIDREVYWTGPVRGWRPKAGVTVGTPVRKTGRTTNFTVGRVTVVNATVDVGYGGGRVARFTDQILTTPMSAGGDSGSLITTLDGIAVGLLFAGSSAVTIANQIENVRALLRVEVAEQIL